MLIESGGEHMTAFVKTITNPVEPIACWTCVRAMLEPCARAAWLMDPAIDVDERTKRTFAIRFVGMEQELKFARATGQPGQAEMRNRIAEVERDASALGYPKLRARKNKNRRTGIGVRMPAATQIVREILDEEGAYRIFSAVTHGQTGTIRQLSYDRVSGNGPSVRIGKVKAVPFQKTVRPDHMAYLGLIAAKAFAKPVWYEFTYAGWDRDPLRELLEATFDLLRAVQNMRFLR